MFLMYLTHTLSVRSTLCLGESILSEVPWQFLCVPLLSVLPRPPYGVRSPDFIEPRGSLCERPPLSVPASIFSPAIVVDGDILCVIFHSRRPCFASFPAGVRAAAAPSRVRAPPSRPSRCAVCVCVFLDRTRLIRALLSLPGAARCAHRRRLPACSRSGLRFLTLGYSGPVGATPYYTRLFTCASALHFIAFDQSARFSAALSASPARPGCARRRLPACSRFGAALHYA
jgi:hypothetical protein